MHRTPLGLLLLTACSSTPAEGPKEDPQYQRSVESVCEVDEMAGLNPEENLIGIDGERYDWMLENVRHPDVIELMTLMRVESSAKRASMLRQAAQRTTLSRCSLADFYEDAAKTE